MHVRITHAILAVGIAYHRLKIMRRITRFGSKKGIQLVLVRGSIRVARLVPASEREHRTNTALPRYPASVVRSKFHLGKRVSLRVRNESMDAGRSERVSR